MPFILKWFTSRSAGEQLFFHDKQFKNGPKHCSHCKQCKAKRVRGGQRVRSETPHFAPAARAAD